MSSSNSPTDCGISWRALLAKIRRFKRLLKRRELLDSPDSSIHEADEASKRVLDPRLCFTPLEPTGGMPLHRDDLISDVDYLHGFDAKLSVQAGPGIEEVRDFLKPAEATGNAGHGFQRLIFDVGMTESRQRRPVSRRKRSVFAPNDLHFFLRHSQQYFVCVSEVPRGAPSPSAAPARPDYRCRAFGTKEGARHDSVTLGQPLEKRLQFDLSHPGPDSSCLQIRYDKVERRIEISATVSEAVAKAFEKTKDLPQEASRVTLRDIAGAGFEPATFGL
jgi:hypothetical protein